MDKPCEPQKKTLKMKHSLISIAPIWPPCIESSTKRWGFPPPPCPKKKPPWNSASSSTCCNRTHYQACVNHSPGEHAYKGLPYPSKNHCSASCSCQLWCPITYTVGWGRQRCWCWWWWQCRIKRIDQCMYRITSTNGIVVIGLSDSHDTKVYAYANYCPEMHNKQNCSPIISTTRKSTPPDSPTRLESSLFSPTNQKLNSPHFPHSIYTIHNTKWICFH